MHLFVVGKVLDVFRDKDFYTMTLHLCKRCELERYRNARAQGK
jgi:hypothetical protein